MIGRAPRALGFLILLVSCRTATPPGGVPFPSIAAVDPDRAWEQLAGVREGFRGAHAFVAVRAREGTKTRSFRASIRISPSGAFQADVLSPLGTVATRIFAEGNRVTIDGQERSIGDLVQLLGLPGKTWTSYELSLLFLGLPPEAGTTRGDGLFTSMTGRFLYEVAATGLAAVIAEGATVRYSPPSFPPQKVTFEGSEQRVEFEFLELLQP